MDTKNEYISLCTSVCVQMFCKTRAKLVLYSVPKKFKIYFIDICILIGVELGSQSAQLFSFQLISRQLLYGHKVPVPD